MTYQTEFAGETHAIQAESPDAAREKLRGVLRQVVIAEGDTPHDGDIAAVIEEAIDRMVEG